jgi:hypothetical protein
VPTTSPPGSLLAVPRPRVEHRPAGVVDQSLAPLVGELCVMAGLPPDPWQADAHEIMFGLRADGNFAAADYAEFVGRQQGKTGGIGVPRILGGLFLLPERRFLWSAHRADASTEAFEITRDALLTLGDEVRPDLIEIPPLDLPGALQESLFVQVMSANGKEGFRTWTLDRCAEWRKRVLMVSRSKGGGRGFAADVRVIDEAYAYTTEQQAALAPTRLARPFGQTLYLSSPPLDGETGAVMFHLRERAEEGDPRLGLRDWGLTTILDDFLRWPRERQKAFIYDRSNWRATLPALGSGRVTEDGVEALIKELADYRDVAREVLGCWPRQTSKGSRWQVISEKSWSGRSGATDRPDEQIAFGVAARWPDATSWAIAVVGRLGDESVAQVVRHGEGQAWVLPELRRLTDLYGAPSAIDPGGPAGVLLQDIADEADELEDWQDPIEVLTPTMREVGYAAKDLLASVAGDAPDLRHFDQSELNAAVAGADRRTLGESWTWQRRSEDVDISPLEAVTLARWASERVGPPPPPPESLKSEPGVTRSETSDLARVGF